MVNLQPYVDCPWVSTVFENGQQYITLYFHAASWPSEKVRVMEPDKCERWEWCQPDELPSPLFAPIEEEKLQLASLGEDDHV